MEVMVVVAFCFVSMRPATRAYRDSNVGLSVDLAWAVLTDMLDDRLNGCVEVPKVAAGCACIFVRLRFQCADFERIFGVAQPAQHSDDITRINQIRDDGNMF